MAMLRLARATGRSDLVRLVVVGAHAGRPLLRQRAGRPRGHRGPHPGRTARLEPGGGPAHRRRPGAAGGPGGDRLRVRVDGLRRRRQPTAGRPRPPGGADPRVRHGSGAKRATRRSSASRLRRDRACPVPSRHRRRRGRGADGAMWVWSVPQQPPSTRICGWTLRRSRYRPPSSVGSPRSSSSASSSSAWLIREALARMPPMRSVHGRRRVEHGGEVVRVGAVDHVVGGVAVGGGVDRLDGLAERLAAGQHAVGLHGEGDDDRDAGVAGRPRPRRWPRRRRSW